MKGKQVFVTGSAGFIGSHVVHALQQAGAKVTAFVHYNSRNDIGYLVDLPGRDKLEIVFGDVRDLALMRTAMQGKEVIFNLASLISVPYSYTHPQEVLEANVGGTMTCLIAAKEAGVKRFLQISSSEVYGSALYVPIDEKHPKQPQSVYAGSKIAADAMAMSFFYSYEFPVTVCRPFNTFGPRQSDRAVISNIIAQALRSTEINLGVVDTRRDSGHGRRCVRARHCRSRGRNSWQGIGDRFGCGAVASADQRGHPLARRQRAHPRIDRMGAEGKP